MRTINVRERLEILIVMPEVSSWKIFRQLAKNLKFVKIFAKSKILGEAVNDLDLVVYWCSCKASAKLPNQSRNFTQDSLSALYI